MEIHFAPEEEVASKLRFLDVPASLKAGRGCPWEDDPLFAQHSMGRQDTRPLSQRS